MTGLEIIATVTGIASVALQAKEKIMAWPFAIVSVAILAYIFFFQKLYSDFGLHLIYVVLNIYGWIVWSRKDESKEVIPTQLLSRIGILLCILITIIMTLIIGHLMSAYTDADVPYLDAFTTSGSLIAQYLLAKKYLQNWCLWITVDLVAIPLYIYKGLWLIAGLFVVYLIISIWGYVEWKKNLVLEIV